MSSSENPTDNPQPPRDDLGVDPPTASTPLTVRTGGHWLHPSSIVFDTISNGKQNLVPAFIALFSAASFGKAGVILAIIIFGGSLLRSVIRYVTLRYQIENSELTVREGLIFKRVRTVPLMRIQNIDSVQNVLHRLFGVAEVRVETAGGKEPEATLRVLSLDKITQLRETVFLSRTAESKASMPTGLGELDAVGSVSSSISEAKVLHTISVEQLVRAGIASNRGVLVFGFLLGAFFQFELHKYFDIGFLFDLLPRNAGQMGSIITVLAGILLLFVATRVYGAIWYLQRFFGYRLTLGHRDFRISCGLFTKVSATVPQKRIQFISVHQPLLMRWFGLASIRIETAGGAGREKEDAVSSVGRRWFIPVIEYSKVNSVLAQLRPGLTWEPEEATWIGVSDKTAKRLCRLAILQSLAIAVAGLVATQPWGWTAGVLVLPFFVYWALRKSRAMRYTETDFGVVYRSGVFTRKLSLTFFDRIQTLRFDQSPFDRRWKMATLSIDTAAAGPADHRIHVKYLDESTAKHKYAELSRKLTIQNA